jgi:hypothetical protein
MHGSTFEIHSISTARYLETLARRPRLGRVGADVGNPDRIKSSGESDPARAQGARVTFAIDHDIKIGSYAKVSPLAWRCRGVSKAALPHKPPTCEHAHLSYDNSMFLKVPDFQDRV